MKKKTDERFGVTPSGHDELDMRHDVGSPGEAAMVPPVDRVTPKVATSPPPPNELDLSAVVALRLASIDDAIKAQGELVGALYLLVAGTTAPDGTVHGGLGKAFHDVNNHLTAIRCTTDTLPDRYVELANEYLRTQQDHIVLLDRVKQLDARATLLEAPLAPNGNGEDHG